MADTKVVKEKVPKAKAEKAEKPAEVAKPKKVRPAKRPFSRYGFCLPLKLALASISI